MLKDIYNWRQTKKGSLTFGVLSLVLAYILLSFAIDTGSILQYLLAVVLVITGVQDLFRIKNAKIKVNAKHQSKKSA
jgi:uncharacterized membrane protein HdeD (DUF308 family)